MQFDADILLHAVGAVAHWNAEDRATLQDQPPDVEHMEAIRRLDPVAALVDEPVGYLQLGFGHLPDDRPPSAFMLVQDDCSPWPRRWGAATSTERARMRERLQRLFHEAAARRGELPELPATWAFSKTGAWTLETSRRG